MLSSLNDKWTPGAGVVWNRVTTIMSLSDVLLEQI